MNYFEIYSQVLELTHRNRKAKGSRTNVLIGAPLIFPGMKRIFCAAFKAASSKYPDGSAERIAQALGRPEVFTISSTMTVPSIFIRLALEGYSGSTRLEMEGR